MTHNIQQVYIINFTAHQIVIQGAIKIMIDNVQVFVAFSCQLRTQGRVLGAGQLCFRDDQGVRLPGATGGRCHGERVWVGMGGVGEGEGGKSEQMSPAHCSRHKETSACIRENFKEPCKILKNHLKF